MSGDILNERIVFLPISSLVPYAEHPFKLYDGEKLDNMIKSVKDMGILMPIIVRPIGDDNKKYEILSGHNRVEAAKSAKLSEVPAIIKLGLNDDEAKLIVTETNLLQRSLSDLSYSERAIALKAHMGAIKKQGKRIDLVKEVENFISEYYTTEMDSTSRLLDTKSDRSDKKLGDKFQLSPRSIARYIRIAELIKPLQNMVDNRNIGIYPAVSLSYLTANEQKKVALIVFEKKYKINMKKAAKLRELSKEEELSREQINEVLSDVSVKSKPTVSPSIKIRHHVYSKYFNADQKQDEIEDIINEAIYEYFKRQSKP